MSSVDYIRREVFDGKISPSREDAMTLLNALDDERARTTALLSALRDASEVLHNVGQEAVWERAVAAIAKAEERR